MGTTAKLLFLTIALPEVLGTPQSTNSFNSARDLLDTITIPNANNIREPITLPTTLSREPLVVITWNSSHPNIISDKQLGPILSGFVTRPTRGSKPSHVTLTACITLHSTQACRYFPLTVQPSISLAPFTRYGLTNFARSNSQLGQQIYMAVSNGNSATDWTAVNNGSIYLNSTKGMHGVRDPVVVRSPGKDKFYLIATDLNVDGKEYGWQGWDWAQSDASRYIEVWESEDLRHWSEQRHVRVAPDEAGMAFAPEAIWDPEIGAYVVYWTSSMYPSGTYFTTNTSDPLRRYPITRNQIWYATTRDFITFTPAQVMSGRPNHGALDAVMIYDDVADGRASGYYHRIVSDRISTGVNVTRYVTSCASEDIYQERSRSILAPPEEWELVASCITHDTMKTTYAEAPLVIKANPEDPRGKGYYMYSDQKWTGSPSGEPMEEQLSPYWSPSLLNSDWKPINWTRKPEYNLAKGVIRHGTIFALTTAEHASLRGADLVDVGIMTGPRKVCYVLGEGLELEGLKVNALYTDDAIDQDLKEGYGGFTVSGFNPMRIGKQNIRLEYTVLQVTKVTSFNVDVKRSCERL